MAGTRCKTIIDIGNDTISIAGEEVLCIILVCFETQGPM